MRFFVINESSGIGLRTHHIGHLVSEQIELRQVFVRIFYTLFGKFPFAFLFVGVCPVEYSLFGELVGSKHFERSARKVQRKTAFDAFQGNIRFIGFYALVCLVKNQHIPIKFRNFTEFLVIATKSLCAFKILQGDKFNAAKPVLANGTSEFIPCQNMLVFFRILFENIHLAYKIVATFRPDETRIIIVPAIGNGGAVGQDKHIPCTNALAKIVCRKGLAKTGLCIPQEFGSLVLFQNFH